VEPPSPEPAEAEGEIPDWLRELEAPAAPTPPPSEAEAEAPAEPEAEVPEWLRELETPAAPTPPPPEAEAEAPAEPEAEVPEWLRELETPAASTPPPPEAEAEAPAEPEAEVPEWLRELEAPAAPTPPPPEAEAEAPAEPEAEVPEWLANLRLGTAAEYPAEMPAEEPEYPEEEAAEEPEWLAALRATSGAEVLELGEEVVETEEEEPPDWLMELRAAQAAEEAPPAEAPPVPEAEAAGPPGVAAPPEEVALPAEEVEAPTAPEAEEVGALDWLAELEALEEAPEGPPTAEEEAPPEAPPPEERKLPEWLVGLPGEEAVEAPPAAEAAKPGEPPAWLQELEREEGEPVEVPPEKPVETEGVLAGLPDLLPVAEEEPTGEALIPQIPDVEGARLFGEIVTERPRPREEFRPEPERRRRSITEMLAWGLVFAALIVAIVLALLAVLDRVGDLLGGTAFREFFGSPLVIDPAPVNTFRAEVAKLSPGAVVVVSFDYGPATEAEMGPLAELIVRDLLDHQARIITVSLRPEGAAMAQRLLDRLKDERPTNPQTLNLGYLPGQTAGVRSLAFLSTAPLFRDGRKSLRDYPAWKDVGGLDDVALIVLVADGPLPVRWWVEQVGPGTQANRPIVAAVSAAAIPTVRPYYNQMNPQAGQLRGLLSGVTGAAAYENRLHGQGRAMEGLAAQSVAHLGLVVLGLVGTLVGFQSQSRG